MQDCDALARAKYHEARFGQDPARLLVLSHSCDFFVRCAVAARKELDDTRRVEMVFKDTRTPKQKEKDEYSLKDDAVRSSAIASGRLDAATIAEIWKRYPLGSVLAIAACPTTPRKILREIRSRDIWIYNVWLCINPTVPSELLESLANTPPIPRLWIEEYDRWREHQDLEPHDTRRIAHRMLTVRSEP